MPSVLTAIIGPTATGKTQLALQLALHFGGEILICDAFQIRKGLPLLTAKPTQEEQAQVPHHLLGVLPLTEACTAAKFVSLADSVIASAQKTHTPLWLCGGTGLYVKALVEGLFPGPGASLEIRSQLREEAAMLGTAVLHQRLHEVDKAAAARIAPTDYVRIERALEVFLLTGSPISQLQEESRKAPPRYHLRYIGLDPGQEELRRRILKRSQAMIEAGLCQEVSETHQAFGAFFHPPLGYDLVLSHLQGELSLSQLEELLSRETAQYARRQRMWFKRNSQITWYKTPEEAMQDLIDV